MRRGAARCTAKWSPSQACTSVARWRADLVERGHQTALGPRDGGGEVGREPQRAHDRHALAAVASRDRSGEGVGHGVSARK